MAHEEMHNNIYQVDLLRERDYVSSSSRTTAAAAEQQRQSSGGRSNPSRTPDTTSAQQSNPGSEGAR